MLLQHYYLELHANSSAEDTDLPAPHGVDIQDMEQNTEHKKWHNNGACLEVWSSRIGIPGSTA